jgi:ligand-binding sensor domain-containing protein
LFPATDTLNTQLQSIDDQIHWVGADTNGNTLIGTDARLHIFDATQGAVGGPYDADTGSLNVDPGNQDVRVGDVAIAAGVALVATDVGLARCSYASGALSSCVQIAGQDYAAVATNGDASLVAAGADSGLFLAAYVGGVQTASATLTEGNSNLPSNNVRDVLLAGTTSYVATDAGLCVADTAATALATPESLCTEVFTTDNSVLPSDSVRALRLDGSILWIGTDDGLVRYNISSGSMIVYDQNSGLIDETIRSIAVDENGIVWLGTDDGMSRLDPGTNAVTNFTADDWGGVDSQVNSVFIDGVGDKWIGTDAGVYRYAPELR